ncbi:MAG: rod shape-determining protein MreD [Xanthomonadales bacterium]
MSRRRDGLAVIHVTLLVAVVLTLVSLPSELAALRPYWVALVLIYWCLETQGLVTLGMAFSVGLVLDLLTGSLLGMHAISLVILIYLVTRFRARLRFFPTWQQALSVFALLLNDRIILLWIVSLRGDPLPPLGFWLPPIVGALLWIPVFLLLDRFRSNLRRRAALRHS